MNFKHKVWWNQSQPYFFDFGWLVATPAASQQRKKIFFLATSTLLQVPVPVSVLKIQVPVQVPVLKIQVPLYQYKWSTSTLHASTSTSTSTKYNKTVNMLVNVVVVFWYCLYGARLLHGKIHVVDTNW